MNLKYNDLSYTVNANDMEMILIAACERHPQSFIHHLSNLMFVDDNQDYSVFVLSKAIRTPIIIEYRKYNKPKNNIEVTSTIKKNKTFYIDKYSLILQDYVNKETSYEKNNYDNVVNY